MGEGLAEAVKEKLENICNNTKLLIEITQENGRKGLDFVKRNKAPFFVSGAVTAAMPFFNPEMSAGIYNQNLFVNSSGFENAHFIAEEILRGAAAGTAGILTNIKKYS